MTHSVDLPSPHPTRPEPEIGGPADAMARSEPASAFEAALQQGFFKLRFADELETRFQIDKEQERLALLQIGTLMSLILSSGLLVSDWMMVPDRFDAAVELRLLGFAPLLGLSAVLMPNISLQWREWAGVIKSLVAASLIIYLCLSSSDPLAPPYLVSLSLIVLFNGGVARVRFWHALYIDVLILLLFAAAMLFIPPSASVPVMVGVALIMVSTVVFTLYGSYWQEHEERANWLMLQHEHLLLAQLESGNRRLDQLTRFDPLTEIANRRHADDFLAQVWGRAAHSGQCVAVLMMDIDHFKHYNDRYGHPAGDACLKAVAAAMSGHLRKPGDMVARYGGEEFIAVLSHTSQAMAVAAAERIRDAVWQLARPHDASPTADRVTLSIGVACLRADQSAASVAALQSQADEALYQAKSRGRNRVFAYTDQGAV